MAKNGMSHPRGANLSGGRPPAPKKGAPVWMWLALGGLAIVMIGSLLVARAGGQSAAGSALQAGKPRLSVDRESIDFGTVAMEKLVKATFKLTNSGDKPLTINEQPQVQVLAGC